MRSTTPTTSRRAAFRARPPTRAERAKYPDGFKSTPLMVGGKLFVRTNFSGVAAIDPATGDTLWTHDPGTAKWGRPGIFGFATRGLAYWSDGRESRILVCTGDSYLVALDPETGAPIPSFGDNGRTDLTQGSRRPLIRHLVNCSAPPTIVGDVAVIGNQIADGPPASPSARAVAIGERTGLSAMSAVTTFAPASGCGLSIRFRRRASSATTRGRATRGSGWATRTSGR